MRLIRWLTVVASFAMLSGCAYPSFNFDSFNTRIRTVTLDQRFPLLKAYQSCAVDCPSCYRKCEDPAPVDYTFAHFDVASSNWTPIITAELGEPARNFTGVANLVPSYSFKPAARVLDTVADDRETSDYKQKIVFYQNSGAEDDHKVIVQLPRERCLVLKEVPRSRRRTELWQPVKFIVVVESEATIFVEMKAPTAQCPGLRVQDVLANVAGIPAELTAQVYRVYDVDLAKVTNNWGYADLVSAPSSAAAVDKVTVQLDPIPDISATSPAQEFVCRVHTSSTDWHIFTGMAATSNGKVSYSRSCKPVKQ
ncbi:hypothetical protein RugamoR57_39630 [Duganella caerulea]